MVIIFSLLLLLGIILGQVLDLKSVHELLSFAASVCLAYIMMEVGLEFSTEKRSFKSYGWDSLIALTAALLPTALLFIYFVIVLQSPWKTALLSGLSAAPTSAGVLFSMLMAAGLGATWVFKKARVLAVLDDLATILLLTPLGIIIHGFEWRSLAVLGLICIFLFASFRWQNTIHWPVSKNWLLIYAVLLTSIVFSVKNAAHIHLEVLIPAFTWGCLIYHAKTEDEHYETPRVSLDMVVKGMFMLLVGLTFPKIAFGTASVAMTIGHVLMLTILANLGKFFLIFCYQGEATLKERMALGVAMFPRGEVGAAVLLIGIGYGLGGYENTLAVLSLALNLVLTGVFIWIVIRLLQKSPAKA